MQRRSYLALRHSRYWRVRIEKCTKAFTEVSRSFKSRTITWKRNSWPIRKDAISMFVEIAGRKTSCERMQPKQPSDIWLAIRIAKPQRLKVGSSSGGEVCLALGSEQAAFMVLDGEWNCHDIGPQEMVVGQCWGDGRWYALRRPLGGHPGDEESVS